MIISGVMMLNHIGETAIAEKIKSAYNVILAEGKEVTYDLGGKLGTREFADALIRRLG